VSGKFRPIDKFTVLLPRPIASLRLNLQADGVQYRRKERLDTFAADHYLDTSDSRRRYNKFPLFYEKDDIHEKMEYDTQLKHFKAMFQHEQVVSSKITHAPHGSSVRHAKDNG
jgi:hypothetical protein